MTGREQERREAWEYYKHADIIHSGRINFFLVAESMLLLSFITTVTNSVEKEGFEFVSICIAILGILFTKIWLYVNIGLFKRMRMLHNNYLVQDAVYKKYEDELSIKMEDKRSPGHVLSYLIPTLLIIFWVILLCQIIISTFIRTMIILVALK